MKAGPQLLALLLGASATAGLKAWVPMADALWRDGPVPVTFDLERTAPANSSGDWNAAALEAMTLWNAKLQRVRLVEAPLAGVEAWYLNGRSEIFFDQTAGGDFFPSNVLAVTYATLVRGEKVESDIIFNRNLRWAVFRGQQGSSSPVDFRRVAVHELGHLLGLDHPDEARQNVAAIMNSHYDAIEAPTKDDEAGMRALYDFGPGAPPVIIDEPQDADVLQGTRVAIMMRAGGRGPLAYQWKRNGVPMAGATQDFLHFPSVSLGDAASYEMRVRNGAGEATSRAIRLTVRAALVPTLESPAPAARNFTVSGGESVTLALRVLAGDQPMRYAWQRNGVPIETASAPSLTINNAQFSDAGTYVLIARNAAGQVESLPFQLTVVPGSPPRFLRDSAPIYPQPGVPLTISAELEGSQPLMFQWKKGGANIAGATSRELVIPSFQNGDAGIYTLVASNSFGSANSSAIAVGNNSGAMPLPVITRMPTGITAFAGTPLNLTVAAENADFGYRWFKDGVPMEDVSRDYPWRRISGSRSPTLEVGLPTVGDSGTYTVEVANAGGTVRSRGVRVAILSAAKPEITAQPSPHTVAIGAAVSLSIGVRESQPGSQSYSPNFSYQWFKEGTALRSGTDARLEFAATLADNGRYFVQVSSDGGMVQSEAADITVTAGAPPIISVHPAKTYFDSDSPEVIRLLPVSFEVMRRRLLRQNINAETLTPVLVRPSGPALGGVTPGTYVMVATRGSETETSRPFDFVPLPPTSPHLFASPESVAAFAGETVTVSVGIYSKSALAYRWSKDGVEIPGATTPTLQIPNFSAASAGVYRAFGLGVAGTVQSDPAVIEFRTPSGPAIQVHPLSQIVREGETLTLAVRATGRALRYQWLKNGVAVAGAVFDTLVVASVTAPDAANYAVMISNAVASVTSRTAQVRVLSAQRAPEILFQPEDRVVPAGGDVTFRVGADGGPLPDRYQWRKNGVNIPNATDVELRLKAVQADAAGLYSVVVANNTGSATSREAVLTIDARSRLINLATRAHVGRGANILIAGFVIGGTEPRRVLVRGVGEQLGDFGVTGHLYDPVLKLIDAKGATVATNDDWFSGGETRAAEVQAAAREAGAFALRDDFRDSALVATLAPGGYTAQVTGFINTTGVGLVEIYELGRPAKDRLINLSSRAMVGTGANILIPGLVLSGQAPRRLLFRAVGPGLAELGVADSLVDPVMKVLRGDEVIAQNDNWDDQPGAAQLAPAMASVGAFPLRAGSRDAALLLDLPPGSYTVQVSGVGEATGIALVEVYEVSP